MVTVDIHGYGKDVGGDNGVYGFQNVTGWSKVFIQGDASYSNYPNSGMGAGIMAYGSSNKLCGNNVSAPSVGPYGNSGNCLGFFAVWGNGGYYYQDVSLPAGEYTITIPIYNACGTQNYNSYIGFVADKGTAYTIESVPTEGVWNILSTSFSLTEETKGKIVLGYVSTGEGSAKAPHLFFDRVCIEEEDWLNCTHLIQNPGFDDDISFNTDGSASKSYINTWEWSDVQGRHAYIHIAEDGSLYSEDIDGQQGYNAAGYPNWDGFKTHIKGWQTTNTSDTAIWIYYGSVPYNLGSGMMMLGGSLLGEGDVVDKPKELNTEDNAGVLYLKAGWMNECTYKQTIKNLPRSKYRLSYFIRNTNVAKSVLYQEATNLCNVTCNGVQFVDNEGFNSEGWIKHTIDFIPVDSFSIEFGVRASNNYSYNNPILWIDGIQLHRIDDVSDEEVDSAYQELITKAQLFISKMHFEADRRTFVAAVKDFNKTKDYVALYHAIQEAKKSEDKYSEIMNDNGVLHHVSIMMDIEEIVPYGESMKIVRFAYNKTMEWIKSYYATYRDADGYIGKLNAYANNYLPVYKEAELFVDSVGKAKTEALLFLMESQTKSLTGVEMLSVEIVDDYVKALRDAMNVTANEKKCATPTIEYDNDKGVIIFNSETEGTEFVSEITDVDIKQYNDDKIQLTLTYIIKVFAKKSGYDNSDVAVASLCWTHGELKTDNMIHNISDNSVKPILIQCVDGRLIVKGAKDGEEIKVYTIDGKLLSSGISNNGLAIIDVNPYLGSVLIVNISEKSVKFIAK